MSWHLSAARTRCRLDGVDDGLVAGTAAIISGQMLANLLAVRARRLLQEILCRHQHSGRAKSALQCVSLTECGLQIGDLAGVRNSLYCLDGHLMRLHREHEAGPHD